jgi:hypothetical protein
VLEPTGLRAGSEGASMMKLDPDQGVYFPYTLARRVRRLDRPLQAGSLERKNIELTEIWLQGSAHLRRQSGLASLAENVVKIGHADKVDFEVKAPISILRRRPTDGADVQLHHGHDRRLPRWSSAGSAS